MVKARTGSREKISPSNCFGMDEKGEIFINLAWQVLNYQRDGFPPGGPDNYFVDSEGVRE